MISGIGIDIVEIDRIANLLVNDKFSKRILTNDELKQYKKLKGQRQAEFLAGRFAAKEAFSKAYGTGIGAELSFQDIEIKVNDQGKPLIIKPLSTGVHLSISHSKQFAVAQVVIETR